MYIEFQLPAGAGGMAAAMVLGKIRTELTLWSEQHGIEYTQKTVKYTHRVCFSKPEEYTFFLTTWNPTSEYATRFNVINLP